jgi:hypothetical protein
MFTIEQVDDIIIKKDGIDFMTVKRKFGWGVTSRFYRNDNLLLETWLFTAAFYMKVKVKIQSLPQAIEMRKEGGQFYKMYYGDNDLSLELKYFRKPPFIIYKNAFEVAKIGPQRLVTFGGRSFKMESDIADDDENTLLLMFFLMQLRELS